jgi:DNA-binding CsgD family transcriptional regulator
VYDAALEPNLWPSALGSISLALGGNAADFHVGGSQSSVIIAAAYGISPEAIASYRSYYGDLDPVVGPAIHRAGGRPLPVTAREVATDTIEQTEFYADWARPNDFDDYLCLPLSPSGNPRRASIGVARPLRREHFGAAERRLLTKLAPHLRRAIEIHLRLTATLTTQCPIGEALDRIATAIILTDEVGCLAWSNAAAVTLLKSRDGLILEKSGHLAASNHESAAQLGRTVREAIRGRGGAAQLRRPSGSPSLAVIAIPLSRRSVARSLDPFAMSGAPRAMLLIVDPIAGNNVSKQRLRQLFRLTDAEASVVIQIATGDGLPAVSESLGVALTTARTHAYRAFDKMEVKGQAELARLVERLGIVSE